MGTALTDLLGTAALGYVTRGIHKAITHSFRTHRMRVTTEAEIKRRFEICTKWFKIFRLDRKFSIERSVDEMTRALEAELHGKEYTPKDRTLWAPTEDPDALVDALVGPDGLPLRAAG